MKKLDTAEEALTKERDARRTEVEQERVQVSKLTSQVADLTSMLDTTKGRLDRAMARGAAASKAKGELAKALESTTSAVRTRPQRDPWRLVAATDACCTHRWTKGPRQWKL